MIEKMKKLAGVLLLAGYVISTSGCFALLVGAAAGAGGMVWAKGKLEQEFNQPLDRVHKAGVSALKKLELPVVVDRKDKLTAKLESKFADGTNVWIDMESLTSKNTQVNVRVGALGDQMRSKEIMEMIEKYL